MVEALFSVECGPAARPAAYSCLGHIQLLLETTKLGFDRGMRELSWAVRSTESSMTR